MSEIEGLTKEIYLKYKFKRMKDSEIARLYETEIHLLSKWKRERGLIGERFRDWSTREKFFPNDIERLKKHFLKLYNQGWKHEHIADELKLGRCQLTTFKDRYFPEIMKRVKVVLTEEQKEIARKNKIPFDTAYKRIRVQGLSIHEAITRPQEYEGWNGSPGERLIGLRKAKDVTGEWKIDLNAIFDRIDLEIAEENGIRKDALYHRVKAGWDLKTAITRPIRKAKKRASKK